MWDYVGIVRTQRRLNRAEPEFKIYAKRSAVLWRLSVTSDLLELRNLADVAELIIRSALTRKESRGLHHMVDFLKKIKIKLIPSFRMHPVDPSPNRSDKNLFPQYYTEKLTT